MKLFGTTHPVKVEQPLTDDRVIEKYLVEFSKFKKENFLQVVLLKLPILVHSRSKVFPESLWNQQGCWVIIRVAQFDLIHVHYVLRL